MKVSLGPIQYYWPRNAVYDFYTRISDAPVDIVYLGEVVCSRRHEMAFEDWLEIADVLAAKGKEVVLSTQVLVEGAGDLKLAGRIASNGRYRVEANDMGAVRMLSGTKGWVAGPHLNLYNPRSLAILRGLGATRWVAPIESSREIVKGVLDEDPVEAELFAHGRLPLAYSARCFTARRYHLQKETCAYRCLEHPDGMALKTREGAPFLVLNGIQTQSAKVYSLLNDVDSLREAGIGILRISPQWRGTAELLQSLRDGRADPDEDQACDGFWHGRPGLERAA
jgi:collagenase-like PrtC family protease